jgi:hypothetical protein
VGGPLRYADARGRLRPVSETWITACCLTFDTPLAALNDGDFQDFVDREGLEVSRSDRRWPSASGGRHDDD